MTYFDVKAAPYSAMGNGTNDDTAEIQSALDAAAAAGGGVVYFPSGIYKVSKAATGYCLDMPGDYITLMGDGRDASIIRLAAGSPNEGVSILGIQDRNNCSVRDLTFDGNWGNLHAVIASASNRVDLPTSTINIEPVATFAGSGTIVVDTESGPQTITYTGTTADSSGLTTSFTGCTGGTGTLIIGAPLAVLNDNTGLNHTTQTDPRNHGLFALGAENLVIDSINVKQTYGDGLYFGMSQTYHGCKNVAVRSVDVTMCARNNITLGSKCNDIRFDACSMKYAFAQALDLEPQRDFSTIRDLTIQSCHLGRWFVPKSNFVALTLTGSVLEMTGENSAAKHLRVRDCHIEGPVLIACAEDVVVDGCTIVHDYSSTPSMSPIYVRTLSTDIRILNTFIYDRGTPTTLEGTDHRAAVSIQKYAQGNAPGNVTVENCTIHAKNGLHGIIVEGTGGRSFSNVLKPETTGSADAVTESSLTDTGAGWTTNQWSGWRVRIGSYEAPIRWNSSDKLFLGDRYLDWLPSTSYSVGNRVTNAGKAYRTTVAGTSASSGGPTHTSGTATDGSVTWQFENVGIGPGVFSSGWAWTTPTGTLVKTPAAGDYTIFQDTGTVEILNTKIDCGTDGRGAGAKGVYLWNSIAGMRVRIDGLLAKNVTGAAVHVFFAASQASDKAYKYLSINNVKAYDDQSTPTTTAVVRFENTPYVDRWEMSGNVAVGGFTTVYDGPLTTLSPKWLTQSGIATAWEGYGSPQNVITAPVGSVYRRLDGGASTSFYVKESDGTGNTGWQGK